MTLTVADFDGQEVTEPRTVANDESKRWRGGKGSSVRVEERANWCYAEILNGGTRRQITQKLADRFNVSQRTADEDYSRATELLKTEQIATRSELLNQIQALRLSACRKAMAKGQLQTVAMLLKDMGAVIGEVAPEAQAAAAPVLRVEIDDKRNAES